MSRTSSLRGSRTTSRTQNAVTTTSAMTACRRSQCAPALYSATPSAMNEPSPSDPPKASVGTASTTTTVTSVAKGARRRRTSASAATTWAAATIQRGPAIEVGPPATTIGVVAVNVEYAESPASPTASVTSAAVCIDSVHRHLIV